MQQAAYFWIIAGWWFGVYIPSSIDFDFCRGSVIALKFNEQGFIFTTGNRTWSAGWMESHLTHRIACYRNQQ